MSQKRKQGNAGHAADLALSREPGPQSSTRQYRPVQALGSDQLTFGCRTFLASALESHILGTHSVMGNRLPTKQKALIPRTPLIQEKVGSLGDISKTFSRLDTFSGGYYGGVLNQNVRVKED